MTKVVFNLDINSDIKNYHTAMNTSNYGVDWSKQIPTKISEQIKNKSEDEVFKILSPILDEKYKEHKLFNIVEELNKYRESKGEILLKIMESIIGKSIPVEVITGTITTIGRCPYDPNKWSFMYNPLKNSSIKPADDSVKTVVHELLHMMLHYYYENYIKSCGLSNQEFHDLKESQTIILNEAYKPFLTYADLGYDIHKEYREKLGIFWMENKNFTDFVDYGIKLFISSRK